MRKADEMDFAIIEAFAAVVEFGGFTRAAERLHLSQPALSRRIALLEHELRQPVFERGRRGAPLTDAGRTFLPHAQAALACLRDGAAAVQALERGDAGNLTLAIVGTLASTDLTAQLGRFHAAHPRVRVLLRTGSSAEVSSLVRRGEAALGLRYFADPAPDVVSRAVYQEPFVVIAAPAHRLAGARRIAPERLRDESWVAFPPRRGAAVDAFGQALVRALAAAGLDGAEIVVIDSLTAQKRLVEAGFGLALVPESSVREELALRTLCRLDVPKLRAELDVHLIHRKGAFLSPAGRRLLEVLSRAPEPHAHAATQARVTVAGRCSRRRSGRRREDDPAPAPPGCGRGIRRGAPSRSRPCLRPRSRWASARCGSAASSSAFSSTCARPRSMIALELAPALADVDEHAGDRVPAQVRDLLPAPIDVDAPAGPAERHRRQVDLGARADGGDAQARLAAHQGVDLGVGQPQRFRQAGHRTAPTPCAASSPRRASGRT